MPFFDAARLAGFMDERLAERGVVADARRHVCNALIQTSLRGVDSHGVNLFPHYCRVVETGRINRDPRFIPVEDAPATGVLDADHGFGHHAGAHAMSWAMEKAVAAGVGAVAVRNSSHFAAAAYYGLLAAERGFVGMAFTNADALVRAHGSSKACFGTNPICVTAPLADEEPLCLDMATSIVSFNRIKNYRRNRQPVDPAWGCDADGAATTDPDKVVALNPIGTYKGFGLGMIVELLCGILANGPYGRHLIPMYEQLAARRSISHFFIALDVGRFLPAEVFRRRLQELVNEVRALPPLPGAEVQVPGDPEKRTAKRRSEEGIPVDEETLAAFVALSADAVQALKP